MKKQVSIFVNPHIYKVLRRDYAYDGVLVIRRRFHIYIHNNTSHPKKMLVPEDHLKEIKIEGPDMNCRKAYAIIRNIEAQFREKMNTFILGQTLAGYPARAAVRDYLERYDILEDELKLDSCYKDWQRFEADEKKRNRIPLWI